MTKLRCSKCNKYKNLAVPFWEKVTRCSNCGHEEPIPDPDIIISGILSKEEIKIINGNIKVKVKTPKGYISMEDIDRISVHKPLLGATMLMEAFTQPDGIIIEGI